VPPDIAVSAALTASQQAAIGELAAQAERADGVRPLSEHALLSVRYGGDPGARELLVHRDGQVAGFGHLDLADEADGPSGELVIDPALRRRGLGRALIAAMAAQAGRRPLRLGAHGDRPAAAGLAAAAGFARTRSLYQLRRPLTSGSALAEPRIPEGITVRPFQVGRDEEAWVELNHLAFASHPEQGSWTRADLELREHEAWFDPAGFFLAERAGRLAGFHWTKVHQSAGAGEHGSIGEVYVVGVDPAEQGSGLGRALTLIGLRYLRDRGLPQVMLYVDGENTAAVRLYESLGFSRWHTDVMFTVPAGWTAA
jgi:mycothiol synthase